MSGEVVGWTTDTIYVKNSIPVAMRNNVREPLAHGLAAFRRVKRDGVARIQEIANENNEIVRFERMHLSHGLSTWGHPVIHVIVRGGLTLGSSSEDATRKVIRLAVSK